MPTREFSLVTKVTEYNNSFDKTNSPESAVPEGGVSAILVAGSQNVLIDGRNGKVRSRPGYTRLGVANTALTPVRKGVTWNNSTGGELPVRFYDQYLEVYLGTVDGTVINAWKRVAASLSTTATPRFDTWYDATEGIDLLLFVQGDTNIYEWGGGVAIVLSVSTTTAALLAVSAISAGGSGYVVGNVLTITGGGGTGATVTVSSVDGSGAVTAVTITTRGSGYSAGAARATSGGSGTGCTLAITITNNSITKTGTTTFGQNRFYNARNKTVVCVRTGTEFTYINGSNELVLNDVADPSALVAGDILVQKIVTQSNKPSSSRINDTLLVFQNQLVLGSFHDTQGYLSKNTSYYDFSYSAPRIAGEGGLLTLDGISGGYAFLSNFLIAFAGKDSIFKVGFTSITVGSTLAETLNVTKLHSGIGQSSISPDCIVQIGSSVAYMTYEPALRIISQPESIEGPQLTSASNPIKTDFDAEDFTGVQGFWYKNALYISSLVNSRTYILEFIEDANGKTRKFWHPPQILPVSSYVSIDDILYGHSNQVPETYKIFDSFSDTSPSDDKLPINCIACLSYRNFKKRSLLKNFDEYYVEGEISPSTNDLLLDINYDFSGHTQTIERTIDGSNQNILEESLAGISLGQSSLGIQPLAGTLQVPADAYKFRTQFEIAREDFNEMQTIFSSNNVDRFWSILAHGPNLALSRRKNISIKQ